MTVEGITPNGVVLGVDELREMLTDAVSTAIENIFAPVEERLTALEQRLPKHQEGLTHE